jgi:hypothetical protein
LKICEEANSSITVVLKSFDSPCRRGRDGFVEGHGRIEQRTVSVVKDADWLHGDRHFPGELRLPGAASVIRVESRAELANRCRFETRYYISSAPLTAIKVAEAVRGPTGE